ncbi:MAG: DUF2723 domain-containing protein [Planctomycetota bacterium]
MTDPPTEHPPADSSSPESPRAWAPLTRRDHLSLGFVAVVLLIATVPRLPFGICRGDPGDLQLAGSVLGIAHPPGYPGYASVLFLLTRVPGLEPAYVVSLACLLGGIAAVLLCMLTQIRLGVHSAVAGAISLLLTGSMRFWGNMLVPEVYAVSLALFAGSSYFLLKYAHTGRRAYLLAAAGLFGFLLGNRPPAAIAAPILVASAWLAASRSGMNARRNFSLIVLATIAAAAPVVYSFAYLLVRDRPTTPYNYIEETNREWRHLPPADAGVKAKIERVYWLTSGQQFRYLFGNSLRGVLGKLRWIAMDLTKDLPDEMPTLVVFALVALGGWVAFRDSPAGATALLAMAIQPVLYVCIYRIYGQAADLMPTIYASGVFLGKALSTVFPVRAWRPRSVDAALVLLGVAAWTLYDAPRRSESLQGWDASVASAATDLPTLPADSVILSVWDPSLPLRYAQRLHSNRQDIQIFTAFPGEWTNLAAKYADRPIFVTSDEQDIQRDYELIEYRNLWRLAPRRDRGDAETPPSRMPGDQK